MAEYDHFAPDYDLWAAEMTEDVAWYVALAREAAGPIVELGIGDGPNRDPDMPTWADRRRTFERVGAALYAREPRRNLAAEREDVEREAAARLQRELGDSWEVPRYVWAESRIDITRGRGDEEIGMLRLWWIGRSELEGLIDVAGLEVEALHGWFDGRPYTEESLEMVWVARKPAA